MASPDRDRDRERERERDRRRETAERHLSRDQDGRRRISQQITTPVAAPASPGAPPPPSAALVRSGSKQQRNVPNALVPGNGSATPQSAAAQVGVPAASPTHMRRASQQANNYGPNGVNGQQHPYATLGGMDYPQQSARGVAMEDAYGSGGNAYGRTSPMVMTGGAAPPALSNVRAMGGDVGVANGGYAEQEDELPPRPSLFIRILTCRCG